MFNELENLGHDFIKFLFFKNLQQNFGLPLKIVSRGTANELPHQNPLGENVGDITVFVLGDTHHHVSNRVSYDRTANLPTTKLMSLIRGRDWHREVRPRLYNETNEKLQTTLNKFFADQKIPFANHGMVVHAGDIGDAGLNSEEFALARQVNEASLNAILNVFKLHQILDVIIVQAFGDHDVDVRIWTLPSPLAQAIFCYELFENLRCPNICLQNYGEQNLNGILVLDTNLLEASWKNRVFSIVKKSRESLEIVIGCRIKSEEHFVELFEKFASTSQLGNLFAVIAFGYEIERRIKIQNKLIKRASLCKKLVIIGHKPNIAYDVARNCNGDVHIVAGHWHKGMSGSIGRAISGGGGIFRNKIRFNILGAATVGVLGVEFESAPQAVLINHVGDDLSIYTL